MISPIPTLYYVAADPNYIVVLIMSFMCTQCVLFSLFCEEADLATLLVHIEISICSPVDTDEVEKSPDERNEEQRALRSTFCPPQLSPMRGSVC